jgi:hypothetical protein
MSVSTFKTAVKGFFFADNPQSNLPTDGIVKSKNENSTFWTVTVKSDANEKSYKKAVKKTLGFACTENHKKNSIVMFVIVSFFCVF